MSPVVLVTDGDQRAALAIVRSLGSAGYRVEVTSRTGRSLAGASRHSSAEHAVPDPLRAPREYTRRIRRLCMERSVALVIPVTDASLLALLPERDRLGNAAIPFPPAATHAAVSDKLEAWRRAVSLGIPVPSQHVLFEPGEAPEASKLPEFPLVVKPRRSIVEGLRGREKTRVRHVDRPGELAPTLASYPPAAYPLLLQERVEGTGEGLFVLLRDGEPVAAMAHRRLREKPPTGGVSVYRESIPLDEDLLRRSVRLLRSFDWEGPAMVEYKRSTVPRDAGRGVPYLMEVNGRFWGSLQLAIDAGVDFPRLLADLTLGRPPATVRSYRTGIRSRWRLGDLDHLLLRWKGGFERSALPPGSPGLLAVTFQVLLPWRPGDREEVFRPTDPIPQAIELKEWLRPGHSDPHASDDRFHVAPATAPASKEAPGD